MVSVFSNLLNYNLFYWIAVDNSLLYTWPLMGTKLQSVHLLCTFLAFDTLSIVLRSKCISHFCRMWAYSISPIPISRTPV